MRPIHHFGLPLSPYNQNTPIYNMKKTIFSALLLVGLLAMAGCRDKTPELELVKDAYGVTQRINPDGKIQFTCLYRALQHR